MSKILISGFIGSDNLGDEAILKSILDNADLDKSTVTALSVNPAKTRSLGIDAVPAKRPRALIRSIKKCDTFLIGGGGLLQDQTSILNFLYYMFQLAVAKRFNKQVLLVFVGVGPIKYRLSRFILRQLSTAVDLAIVRDDASKRQLTEVGMKESQIVVAHDPVLNFNPQRPAEESPYLEASPYIVVALRRWFFTNPILPVFVTRKINRLPLLRGKYTRFISNLASDLDDFLSNNPRFNVVFVAFNDREDREVMNNVVSLLRSKDLTLCAPPGLSEETYIDIVSSAEFLLGMRLHSLILASTVGTPFVGLRYSLKVDEFVDQMKLHEKSIHVERYDSKHLQDAMSATLRENEALRDHITTTVDQYRRDNTTAFETLKRALA